MKNNNVQDAIQYLNESLENLINGTVSMDKLTITKALRSDYKNPVQIGHWVLAERIGKRDPGNRPKPGDRMKFVFIENKDKKALVGDKIETPEFILENKEKDLSSRARQRIINYFKVDSRKQQFKTLLIK